MGNRGLKAVYGILFILAAAGAVGYGVSTWKMLQGNREQGRAEPSVHIAVQESGSAGKESVLPEDEGTMQSIKTGEMPKGTGGVQEVPEETEKAQKIPEQTGKAQEVPEETDSALENPEEGIVFGYVDEKTAVPELSEEVLVQVERINHGEGLAQVTGLTELKNHFALIGIKGIIAWDKETGEEVDGGGEVTLYVPNLIQGLSKAAVLFYGRESGQWEVISVPESAVDTAAKMLTAELPGAGLMTVIYQRE